jgi:serine/threonine protein kinase
LFPFFSANIMVDRLQQVKLIDFGVSRELRNTNHGTSSNAQTLMYAPPESVSGSEAQIHPTSDLFSLGLVLYHVLTARETWGAIGQNAIQMFQSTHLQLPMAADLLHKAVAAEHLIRLMVRREPQQRAYYNEMKSIKATHELLLKHPFFWSNRKATNFLVALGNLTRTGNIPPAFNALATRLHNMSG